ncbi:sigma-70 family RNA polymerase sigma factor [Acidobacteria bacterium AH-259-D05]|nr:sigma-70 family RNA polymerase sigma factor [Acidobacteria bacterium AH-259-D05]
MPSHPGEVTQLLMELKRGNQDVLNQLLPLLYDELRRLARHYMRQERMGHTLESAALVNEAYLRLVELDKVNWQDRAHFVAVAAGIMRRLLIDHARKRQTAKRGGDREKLPLEEGELLSQKQSEELVELDEALTRLEALDRRQSQIVEVRFFGGLTVEETAEVLGISSKTVKRDWAVARAWLRGEIGREPAA